MERTTRRTMAGSFDRRSKSARSASVMVRCAALSDSFFTKLASMMVSNTGKPLRALSAALNWWL